MIRGSDCNIKKLILSLLVFLGFISALFSQTRINGTINKYGKVTALGTDYVIVDDPIQFAQFKEKDTVLLIQMKGVRIYSAEHFSYGTPDTSYGKPGKHEFLIVQDTVSALKKIIFRNNIINPFSIDGALQIIKVPSYNSVVVDISDLNCMAWDSAAKIGGVLTMIVGRTLSLNKNIDVSEKGFFGGATSTGTGLCVGSDAPNLDKYAYNSSFTNSGFKGESPVIRGHLTPFYDYPPINPGYSKGKGANLTGGGGGYGRFSGGGGGSNYGAGGRGGLEIGDCFPTYVRANGGLGGIQLKLTPLDGDIFLGGGGGSSTYQSLSTPSPGGKGGGIVIIICDTLKGNGKSIIANGGSAATAGLNEGSGGGGGGGTVAIYLQSFSTSLVTSGLTINANGGKGGANTGSFGEGGGGGGGFVNIYNITVPANVTRTVTGGAVGTRPGGSTGGSGTSGENRTLFVPVLNGFLFNSVRSSVSQDQVDSICSNVIPKEITGTLPVGGSGSYTYLWQKSYNILGPATDIASSNTKNFTPVALETDTVWFRRIVKDDITALTDTSKWVEIRVQSAITGNLVGKDTTICYNQDPLSLIPLNTGPVNGNGHYKYKWLQDIANIVWDTTKVASGTIINNPAYDPPPLAITTYYKRFVQSGRCIDYSPTVTITVLPSITGNSTIRSDSVICEGRQFNTLGASAAGGGNLAYKYQWQDSTVSGIWISAAGVNDGLIYSTDTSTFALIENRFFRRVVYSGPDSVCRNNSSPILLTRYHKIKDNSILADQTICSGNPPLALSGSTPAQGKAGDYTYSWQDSSKVGTWTTRGTTNFIFSPPALSDTTWYRRIVYSGIYKSAPVCTDTSLSKRIDVHKPIVNNIASLISGSGPDTTICSGAIPDSIMGSIPTGGTDISNDYAYLWESSTTSSVAGFSTAPGVNTNKSYKPGTLTLNTWFRRKVISGMCETTSNSIRVIVLPPITNNVISSDQTVCYATTPLQLTGPSLTGGAGGTPTWIWQESIDGVTWTGAYGTINQQNYSPPSLTIPMKYRRIIRSGLSDCCTDTSNVVSVGIHPPLPTGTITSTLDTTICEGSKVSLRIHLTGESKWKVVYNENSTKVTVSNIAGTDTTLLSGPVSGTALTTFNYSLYSVEDKNGCFASSLTGTRKADVYKVPIANAGDPSEVCGPIVTLNATPSVGTGTWYYPSAVLASTPNSSSVTVTIDSLFAGKNITHKFYWEEINWQCKNKDSVIITFCKRVAAINAGPDTAIYSFDNIVHMVAEPVLTWETGLWTVISGTGDFEDNSDNMTGVRNLSKGINIFLWTITNGACELEDPVKVTVNELIIPEGFSPNNDNFNNTFIITGLDLPNQIAEMTVVNGAGTEVFSTTNRDGQSWTDWDGKNSKGNDLPEGTYYYLLRITSNGNGQVFKKSGFIVLKRY